LGSDLVFPATIVLGMGGREAFDRMRAMHEGVRREVIFALTLDGHVPQGAAFHGGFKAGGS
jgi:hypothetical protein